MKNFMYALALFSSITFTAQVSAEQIKTKEVVIGVSEVYVPGGFSSATDAYVIVSGMFPNSCYKWARAEITNQSPTVHEIKSIAVVNQQMCLMVMVPYTKEINLGRLVSGEHVLRFLNGDGTFFEKTLTVE